MVAKPGSPSNMAPTDADVVLGALLREKRLALGTSQQQLAVACGITFQQVQKYERAANRISVSRLFAIAAALGTTASALVTELEARLTSQAS